MHPRHYLMSLVFATLLLPVLELTPTTVQSYSTALAQTAVREDRQAEADRLFQQGIQQHQRGQFREALQFWQQALAIH